MATRSLSFSNALQDLGTLLNRIAIAQTVPSAVPDELPERDDVLRLASVFTPEDIQLCYQIVVHGRNELGLAPDEYAGFTMTLLRMLAFAPVTSSNTSANTSGTAIKHAAAGNASSAASQSAAAATKRPAAASSPAPMPSAANAAAESPAMTVSAASSDKKPVSPAMAALAAARGGKTAAKASPTRATPTVAPTQDTATPAAPLQEDFLSEPVADSSIPASAEPDTAQKKTEQPAPPELNALNATGAFAIDWPALVRQLPLKGVAQQLATQSELLGSEDEGAVIVMQLRVPVETLLSAGSVDKLAAALGQHFEKTVRLVTEIGNVTHTAHAESVADQARRQQQAEQTLNDDPFVQTLMRDFGATIVPGSIKPV
jgi:DNA polymerase-3 subunit gamma/tau